MIISTALFGCHALPPALSSRVYVNVDLPDAGVTLIEGRILAQKDLRGTYPQFIIQLCTGNRILDKYGVPSGIEGAPVVGADGVRIGAISGAVGDSSSLILTAFRSALLEEGWRRGNLPEISHKSMVPLADSQWRALQPGEHVLLVSRWNPSPRVFREATVIEIRGNRALCLPADGEPAQSGVINLGVVRAVPLAVAPLGVMQRPSLLFEEGPLLGRAVYECALGITLALGEAPAINRCSFRFLESGRVTASLEMQVAREVRDGTPGLESALGDFVWRVGPGYRKGVNMTVDVDGIRLFAGPIGDNETVNVQAVSREVLRSALLGLDTKAIDRIDVDIALPPD